MVGVEPTAAPHQHGCVARVALGPCCACLVPCHQGKPFELGLLPIVADEEVLGAKCLGQRRGVGSWSSAPMTAGAARMRESGCVCICGSGGGVHLDPVEHHIEILCKGDVAAYRWSLLLLRLLRAIAIEVHGSGTLPRTLRSYLDEILKHGGLVAIWHARSAACIGVQALQQGFQRSLCSCRHTDIQCLTAGHLQEAEEGQPELNAV